MPVRRPEYDTFDTYWASAGPRILSYTWLAHRNITPARRFPTMADISRAEPHVTVGEAASLMGPWARAAEVADRARLWCALS
jgi:hypothetical protein